MALDLGADHTHGAVKHVQDTRGQQAQINSDTLAALAYYADVFQVCNVARKR